MDDLLLASLGAVAEVLREDNRLHFVGQVTHYDIGRQELRVDLHRGKETPQGVIYGAPVKVQIHDKGQWSQILMIYGNVIISAPEHWKIQVDHVVLCEETRQAYRQKVKAEGYLVPAVDENARILCTLDDISMGGVGFHSKAELERGDRITLYLPSLTGRGDGYRLSCKVVVRGDSDRPNHWRYGCSFERLDQRTDSLLCKEIFQLQAQSMSRGS